MTAIVPNIPQQRAPFQIQRTAASHRPRSLREDLNMEVQMERARMDRLHRRYTCHMQDYQSTCATADTHQIFLAAMLGEILRYQQDQVQQRVVSVGSIAESGVELAALRENATIKLFHLRAALKEIHRQIFGSRSLPASCEGRRASSPSTNTAPAEDRYARQLRDISTFRLFDPIKPRVDSNTSQAPLRRSTPPRG